MRFSVDPWDPAYGTSLDTELGASTAEVDVDVELPAERWRPLDPPPGVEPPAVVRFVDGVRRIDAQIWVDEPDGSASPALCASYAAGVVCCCAADGAHLVDARVRRGLFTTADGADIVTAAGPTPPPAPRCTRTGRRCRSCPWPCSAAWPRPSWRSRWMPGRGRGGLTVLDGPLPPQALPGAIGFVKSHRDTYLPRRARRHRGHPRCRAAHPGIPAAPVAGPAVAALHLVPAAAGRGGRAVGRGGAGGVRSGPGRRAGGRRWPT